MTDRYKHGTLMFVFLAMLIILLSAPDAIANPPLLAGAAAFAITPVDEGGRPWQEPYQDRNGNGRYDAPDPENPKKPGEPFTDLNGNGKWDGPYLAGFSHHRHYYIATGVHDPLWARALVLELGDTKLAFVALDLVGFFYPQVLQIREHVADLGMTQVVVASTHTHGGPDTLGLWGPNIFTDGKDPRFIEYIARQSERAIREAWALRRPAKLTFGKGRPPTDFGAIINDLRDPIVIDEELLAMKVEGLDGKTITTLINWTPHPETLGGSSSLITSDFPHYLRKGVEEGGFTVGGRQVKGVGGIAIYMSGSVGGLLSTLKMKIKDEKGKVVPERSFEKAERVGELAAFTAIEAIRKRTPSPIVRIEVKSKRLFLPFDNPFLRGLYARGIFQRETYKDRMPAGKDGPDLLTEVNVINFYGPQEILGQLVTVPGELFPEIAIGGYLKDRGRCWLYTERKWRLNTRGVERVGPAHPDVPPEPVLREKMRGEYKFIIGLANDELGYIVPSNDFVPPQLKPRLRYGKDRCGDEHHYEETLSASSKMAPLVADSLVELLK